MPRDSEFDFEDGLTDVGNEGDILERVDGRLLDSVEIGEPLRCCSEG